MRTRLSQIGITAIMVLFSGLPAGAQLLPQVTEKPKRTQAPKPTQIVVETSPAAQVYLDDAFKGQASPQGRLVIESARPGEHTLRISLAGKRDYEERITVTAGQLNRIQATMADAETAAPTVEENSKEGLKYVWIPAGTFQMGCSPGDAECDADEKPSHSVKISKGFWMEQTDVTVGAYRKYAASIGAGLPNGQKGELTPILFTLRP